MNNTFKATVVATKEKVVVYKVKSGGWANYQDPKITYTDAELEDIKENA